MRQSSPSCSTTPTTKVLIVDTEFGAGAQGGAARMTKVKPLVDRLPRPRMRRRRDASRQSRLRGFHRRRRPGLCLGDAVRRVERHLAQLHERHHRQSEGRRLPPSRRGADVLRERASPPAWASTRSISGRCRCSTATAGASPGRSACSAGTHVCLRSVRAKPMYDAIADHRVTHLSGAPFVMSALLNAADDERRMFPPARRLQPCRRAAPRRRARQDGRSRASSSPISTG